MSVCAYYMYTYIYIYIYIYMDVCMYVYVYVHMYIYMCVYVCIDHTYTKLSRAYAYFILTRYYKRHGDYGCQAASQETNSVRNEETL